MILDAITIVCIWMAILFNILDYVLKGTDFGFLPWGALGIIFLIVDVALIRWRGKTTTGWNLLEMPSLNQKLGIVTTGPSIRFIKLYPSIATYLKTKNDEYYRDIPDGAHSFGGHDARLIDSETAYCTNPMKARLVNELEQEFYDYQEMKDGIRQYMANLKDKDGSYLLSGEAAPLSITDIDIENNKGHKELFEALADEFFIKVHGRVYTLKNYARFQDKQAAPYQIGSIIHYVKALAAMRAAGVKKGMGGMGKYILIIIAVIIIIAVLGLVLTGNLEIPELGGL